MKRSKLFPGPGALFKLIAEKRNYVCAGRGAFYHLAVFFALMLGLALQANAVTINVTATGSPTASDNNYTRINNAIQSAAPGDVIMLSGTFDWTESNAAARWALGSDATASTSDDYSILVPAGKNNITLTALSLGAARIQGPGDLASIDLEGVLFFDGGDNQNWTISNIEFFDFDLTIGMFGGAGGADAFNNTVIENNHIRIANDLNAVVAPADTLQNIGIHFAYGVNQRISGNIIDIPGNGVSSGTNFSSMVGMQSNTSGGSVYNGLQISGNTLTVTDAQSANPSLILGIWENAHAHLSNISVSGNSFTNSSGGNNPALNFQRGFRVTSHSSGSSTVTYAGNTASGANIGFQWITGSVFSAQQAVRMTANTITGNDTGILVQSQGRADLTYNRIVSNTTAGVSNVDGNVTALNNWWGCNYGPGAGGAGCTGTANGVTGAISASPWLTLTTSANPTVLTVGGTSAITSSMRINSASADTSGPGTVPNGIPAAFSSSGGSIAPPSAVTTAGLWSATFTAGSIGAASASTTVDSQTVSAPLTVAGCRAVTAPAGMTALRNSAVTVPISVDDVTGMNVISYDFVFSYNASTLTYTGFDQTATLSAGMVVTINSSTPGTLRISGFQANPITGSGTLLKLNFTASGPIGSTSALNMPSFALNEGSPCSTVTNGNITIISGTVSGVVSYANTVGFKPVPNTVLTGTGTPNVSTNSAFFTGAYTLSGFGPGAYTVTPSKVGDVNGISGFDSGLIAQYVVGLGTLNPTQLIAADVSEAAGVTSFDAGLIARYVAMLPNFGVTGNWVFSPTNRSYPNVETGSTNQDYSAILMGEVSGDWIEPTSFAPPLKQARAPEATVTVTAPTVIKARAIPIDVFITTSDVSPATAGTDVISYQFVMTYDPTVIVPRTPAATAGGTISENASVTVNATVPGQLIIVVFRAEPFMGAGDLLRLQFTAVGDAGDISPLTFQSFQWNEGNPPDANVNGQIQLVGPTAADAALRGRVLDALGQPIAKAKVTLTDVNGGVQTVMSNPLGYYEFSGLQAGRTYFLNASAKNRVFTQRVVSVSEELLELDLIAEP